MELLQFVFSSFWVWLGCVVLIVAAGEAVATAAAGFRQKRKVSVYHVGDVTRVEVSHPSRGAWIEMLVWLQATICIQTVAPLAGCVD